MKNNPQSKRPRKSKNESLPQIAASSTSKTDVKIQNHPWYRRVESLTKQDIDPPSKGFINDAALKKLIKKFMGSKPTPCPKDVSRDFLLQVAQRLNLISRQDADLTNAPKKTGRPLSWAKRIEHSKPRDAFLFDENTGFLTDRQLKMALEEHLGDGVRAPESIGRRLLLEQVLKLNIISKEHASIEPPTKIDTKELKTMLKEHLKKASSSSSVKVPDKREDMLKMLVSAGILTDAQAEAKVTRKDKSDAMQESRLSKQASRRTSIKSLFKGIANAKQIQDSLIQLSDDASRLFYQRSFLIWLHLARLLDEGLPLPNMDGDELDKFVRQAYTIRTLRSTVKNPEMEKTLDKHPNLFPFLPRPDKINVVTHAANALAGALRRHFANEDTVKQRIKRFASVKLFGVVRAPPPKGEEDAEGYDDVISHVVTERPEVGDSPLYNIIGALECNNFQEESMHPRQLEVLSEIRSILGLARGVQLDKNWLRANIHSSIRFSLTTCQVLDDLREQVETIHQEFVKMYPDESTRPKLKKGCARGLHFVPLNSLKRRFVTVDATDMAPLLGIESLVKGNNNEENVEQPLVAHAIREMLMANVKEIYGEKMAHHPDKATTKGEAWYLTGTFDTDGYSIHPHFQRRKKTSENFVKNKSADEAPPKIDAPPRLLLLVDPGRVNLVTITVMVDGVLLMRHYNGKKRPLKFTFTAKQYYSLTGQTRNRIIREKRQKKDVIGEKLRKEQSATSLRTGNYQKIVEYIEASLNNAAASDQSWARALKKGAANERWRREAAKESAMLKWFYKVKRSVGAITGLYDATVVWGCKVAATGKGNLSVPTERSAKIAERVKGWKLVRGDEYKTSANACVSPHPENIAPRFRGTKIITRRRMKKNATNCNKVRDGWVVTLSAKRSIRRLEEEKEILQMGLKGVKRPKERIKWEYEGTSLDSDEVKAAMKKERQALGLLCKYVRGLRVLIIDLETTKFFDRDACGSQNIGLLWLCDNVTGRFRPVAFIRPSKKTTVPV